VLLPFFALSAWCNSLLDKLCAYGTPVNYASDIRSVALYRLSNKRFAVTKAEIAFDHLIQLH
jgi:hypothetical protein